MDQPPDDLLEQNAAPLAALGEPLRRALYRFVAGSAEPVSREQAAAGTGIAAHTAKFHLDKLVDEGLLEVEFRRLTGRTGPGAGRPAKLYRRSEREFALSLPERHYDLIGQILAEAVDTAVADGRPVDEVAREVARRTGSERGREAAPGEVQTLDELAGVLEAFGYEPVISDGRIVLENCPFDRMAQRHTELVCGLNVEFVDGVATGLGCQELMASLEPSPGRCCVCVREKA